MHPTKSQRKIIKNDFQDFRDNLKRELKVTKYTKIK